MHLGNARTALLAWLDARAGGGRIVLRIEDLDPQRSHRKHAELVQRDLAWLGLDYDEGPYYQSRRTARYAAVLEALKARDLVYPCWCSRADVHRAAGAPHLGEEARYPGTCARHAAPPAGRRREPAWRLRTPARAYAWDDLVLGASSERADLYGDLVVRRADGAFGYQLAVAIDDAELGITRAIRGGDLITSTPRQLALYDMLNYRPPRFGHVPLLFDAAGRRLAKRTPSTTISGLRDAGEDPRAVVGMLAAQLGWAAPGQRLWPRELLQAGYGVERIGAPLERRHA
ncbi:tRNA glutamyl-Q(34) synthetase GluQRS [bacterium]|nr:MAG: tRNA glutamyl-Q(34) synthetase GluQRS [bacterium]